MMNIKTLALSAVLASAAGIAQSSTIGAVSTPSGFSISGTVSASEIRDFNLGPVSGTATITLVNFGEAASNGGSPFSAKFEFFADGELQSSPTVTGGFQNFPFGSLDLAGQELSGNVTGVSGSSSFNISVDIAPVPLPAAGILLVGALGGLGLARRRKKS